MAGLAADGAEAASASPVVDLPPRRWDRDVKVQGYITDSPVPLPSGEDVVHIPAEAWVRLLSRLPVRMLLRALFTRSVRRPVRQPQQQ